MGFVIDKPHTHSTIWRKAILSFAWVLIVVVPTVFAFQFTGQFSESSLPHASLQQYTNGAAISGKQIVSIPAGTIIPMDVTVTGNVLGNTDTTRFPLRLTQPVDVVVEDGKPTGVYRVGQTAEKEKWLRVHTSMRIKDFKMESKPAGRYQVQRQNQLTYQHHNIVQETSNIELDRVLHQPVRTRIVAYLAARGESTFTDLKHALEVTDGNLEAHMKKLVSCGYVSTRKETSEGRPQTLYSLSQPGEEAFKNYVDALQQLLHIEN